MDAPSSSAWQPITPHGVAAFARAPLRRLLLVQFIIACCVSVAVAWVLYDRHFPIISTAIANLPAEGQMAQQRLDWRGDSPVMLAENRFLALCVDLEHTGQLRSVAHLQVELGRTTVLIHSLFGYLSLPYPEGWSIAINRETALPFWGAWRPAAIAVVIVSVILWLFFSWFGLATVYMIPIWWLGLYANRTITWRAAWRLGGAALLPGALLMLVGLSLYDLGAMDLVQMTFLFGAHLVVGWAYVILGLWALPREGATRATSKNPFARLKPK